MLNFKYLINVIVYKSSRITSKTCIKLGFKIIIIIIIIKIRSLPQFLNILGFDFPFPDWKQIWVFERGTRHREQGVGYLVH